MTNFKIKKVSTNFNIYYSVINNHSVIAVFDTKEDAKNYVLKKSNNIK